jgi:uncharacterized protein (TIGR03382 family)
VSKIVMSAALATAIGLVLMSAGVAHAGVIAGPATLSQSSSGWQYSGVGFTANVNATLTSFTFENQGKADTVDLVNAAGTIFDSVAIPAGDVSDTVSVSWSLTAGSQYYLLNSVLANAMWDHFNLPLPTDTEITMTDTGIFSTTLDTSGYATHGNEYWTAFLDITTSSSSSSVPEPASITLVLPVAVAVLLRARRKGRIRHE